MNPDRSAEKQAKPRLLLLLLLLLLLVGLVWFRERTLTIAIHQGVEGIALKEVIRRFSSREGISVEVVEFPYDALFEREAAALKARESPYDVIMLDDPWLPELIGQKEPWQLEAVVLPCERIEEFVSTTLVVSRHPYTSAPISCDDVFYAVPFVGNSQLFVRHKPSAGQVATWNDVVGQGYVMRVGSGNSIVTDFMPMLWAASPQSFTVSDTPRLLTSASAALEHLAQFGQTGPKSLVSADDVDLAVYLVKGEASTAIVWSAWAMAIQLTEDRLPEPYKTRLVKEIEFVDMPGGEPALGAWLLAVPANAGQKRSAHAFLSFATEIDQIKAAAKLGNPPPLKKVFDDPALKEKFRSWDSQRTSLEKARPRPRTPRWRDIEAAMGACLSRLYDATVTVEQASKRINQALDAISAERTLSGFTCTRELPGL